MRRRSGKGQAGFIITLELVLIFTILGLGLTVGIVAIRNAVVKFLMAKQSAEIYVVDSGAPQKIVGKAFDLDEHEAPRVQFVDQDVTYNGVTVNRRVIIGVRDDRFTTRHRIFYENSADCGATDPPTHVCIVQNGNEDGDNLGVGYAAVDTIDTGADAVSAAAPIAQAGGIGYLYPLQTGPAYGIGRDADDASGLPGTLYRETDANCDPALIFSVWTSQTVISGTPCAALPGGATVTAAKCPPGADGANAFGGICNSPADSRCVVAGTCDGGAGDPSQVGAGCMTDAECGALSPVGTCDTTDADKQCACPATWDGNDANDWVDFGSNCCPPGTTQTAPGQCSIGNNGTIREATPVLNADGDNALSGYVAPFRISVPLEPGLTWQANAPGGFEGAPPGAVIPGGTDVDTIDYAAPADSEEGPP